MTLQCQQLCCSCLYNLVSILIKGLLRLHLTIFKYQEKRRPPAQGGGQHARGPPLVRSPLVGEGPGYTPVSCLEVRDMHFFTNKILFTFTSVGARPVAGGPADPGRGGGGGQPELSGQHQHGHQVRHSTVQYSTVQ